MNKHWAVLLLAIAATQAFAGEKEYTFRHCESLDGWYANRINDCSKCKEVDGEKISFKASKQLNSVMEISTRADGISKSSVIENCKIFDENNFQCTTETEAIYSKDFFDYGKLDELVVSNGKWENAYIQKGRIDKTKKLQKGEKVIPDKFQSYDCGYEIKNVFNFFK